MRRVYVYVLVSERTQRHDLPSAPQSVGFCALGMSQPPMKSARKGAPGLKIDVPEPTAVASPSVNNQCVPEKNSFVAIVPLNDP